MLLTKQAKICEVDKIKNVPDSILRSLFLSPNGSVPERLSRFSRFSATDEKLKYGCT
jgi:hypothetical protein